MTVSYKLIRIEDNHPEKVIELSENDMDLIWLGLEEYQNIVMDNSSFYYDEQVEAEYSELLYKLMEA